MVQIPPFLLNLSSAQAVCVVKFDFSVTHSAFRSRKMSSGEDETLRVAEELKESSGISYK